MKLDRMAIEWAIKHIEKQRDTDLFPRLKEYEILFQDKNMLIDELSQIDIGSYI